ncbi:MAG: tetratricopeptide repeat protein [Pseudonocardiaceae bacterium]
MADCRAHSLARQLVQDLLQDMQMVLGPDHPETLRTRSNLAWVTGETGDAAEALQLYAALPGICALSGVGIALTALGDRACDGQAWGGFSWWGRVREGEVDR